MAKEHPHSPVALYITRAHGSGSGGMERFSYELVQALDDNPDLRLRTLTHKGSRLTAPIFVFSILLRALNLSRQADIIYLADPLLSLVGFVIKKVRRKPVAVNVHGLDITYRNIFYRLYLYLFFRHFDLYLPISRHVQGLLEKKRVSGKIQMINPALSDRYFDRSLPDTDLDNIIGLNTKDSIILLTVGRLVKRKGHAWFITEVLPHLPNNCHYVIAGSGPESLLIRNAAFAAGVSNRVIHLGRVDEGALKILYNTAHAFVQPNIKTPNDIEGFGLVVLEAALCGCPVFASDLEGLHDSIANGKNGVLIPTENPIAWIMHLRKFCETRQADPTGAAARQYTIEHFNWSDTSAKYIAALASLIKPKT